MARRALGFLLTLAVALSSASASSQTEDDRYLGKVNHYTVRAMEILKACRAYDPNGVRADSSSTQIQRVADTSDEDFPRYANSYAGPGWDDCIIEKSRELRFGSAAKTTSPSPPPIDSTPSPAPAPAPPRPAPVKADPVQVAAEEALDDVLDAPVEKLVKNTGRYDEPKQVDPKSGIDAKHCVTFVGSNIAARDGLLVNNCPYEVEAAWCVIGYDCKGALANQQNLAAQGSPKAYWPVGGTAGKGAVDLKWGACKGKDSVRKLYRDEDFSYSCREAPSP